MKIAIITNLRDNKGLAVDSRILKRLLTSWGHDVHVFDFRELSEVGPQQLPRDLAYTVVFHLEVVQPRAFSWSDKQVFVPNPDWCDKEKLYWADAFRAILAKTHAGYNALVGAGLKRVYYTGFESEDRMLEGVPRERVFFHSWSQSVVKGTRTVLRAWDLLKPELPSSFLVGSKLGDDAYRREQNRCLFWIQPSAVEGYGHIIHEGLSCGALVAVLDAPPMNESPGLAATIPCRRVSKQNLADVWEARPEAIRDAAARLWDLSPNEIYARRAVARHWYDAERAEFRKLLREALENL